jgi:hypothetical protein
MPEMKDEEYDALEEFIAEYPSKLAPSKARHAVRMAALDICRRLSYIPLHVKP